MNLMPTTVIQEARQQIALPLLRHHNIIRLLQQLTFLIRTAVFRRLVMRHSPFSDIGRLHFNVRDVSFL